MPLKDCTFGQYSNSQSEPNGTNERHRLRRSGPLHDHQLGALDVVAGTRIIKRAELSRMEWYRAPLDVL